MGEEYSKRYEDILRRGIRKAKVVGFMWGYESERLSDVLTQTRNQTYDLMLEMEKNGQDTRLLNSKKLLSLDLQLFSLQVNFEMVQLVA